MITKKEFTEITHEADWYGTKVSFKTGKLAPHCDGAVEVTMGETKLLVTAVMEKNPDINKGWFPLSIEYRESYYAAGKIGGGRFRKREGRPSDDSVLYARLTDRPLRPMFPKGMVNDVVITISPMQLDFEHSPGELSIIGSSMATLLAGIPFAGPVGAVRVGYIDGQYVVNMTDSQAKESILDLHVAGTKDQINMLEAGGNECPMDIIKGGLREGQKAIAEICAMQEAFAAMCSITPKEIIKNKPSEDFLEAVRTIVTHDKLEALGGHIDKNTHEARYAALEKEIAEGLAAKFAEEGNEWNEGWISEGLFTVVKDYIRTKTINEGVRIDGRGLNDIRPIHCEIDVMPRVHGTGLFWRGDTQVLSLLTLGSPGDAELVDDMENDSTESRWMLHYKFPPFCNNEARMIRFTNRREIGHGRLAEKAIEPMLPEQESFPYTMRMVSECLGSGGSTSMASVCSATLALMAGGVPMKKPVSGIAMGLMTDDNNQVVLTDIKGTEDFTGDMDFKLAGTDEGMTAIQMDTKLQGLGVDKLEEMLDRAQAGRTEILAYMMQTISQPKTELSPHAPYIMSFKVKPDQIREIIGPGGSVIQEIVRETEAKIDLEDDGSGTITGKNKAQADAAMARIKAIIRTPEKGDKMEGKITRVEKYGVFVDLGNKKTGLCHVKQLGEGYIEDVAALYKIGDSIKVEVFEIDRDGKIALKKIEE